MITTKDYKPSIMDKFCKELTKILNKYLQVHGKYDEYTNEKLNDNIDPYDIDLVGKNVNVEVEGNHNFSFTHNFIYVRKLKWAVYNGKRNDIIHYEIHMKNKAINYFDIYKMKNMENLLDCDYILINYDAKERRTNVYDYKLIPKKTLDPYEIKEKVFKKQPISIVKNFNVYSDNGDDIPDLTFLDNLPKNLEGACDINRNMKYFEHYTLERGENENGKFIKNSWVLTAPTKNKLKWRIEINEKKIDEIINDYINKKIH